MRLCGRVSRLLKVYLAVIGSQDSSGASPSDMNGILSSRVCVDTIAKEPLQCAAAVPNDAFAGGVYG